VVIIEGRVLNRCPVKHFLCVLILALWPAVARAGPAVSSVTPRGRAVDAVIWCREPGASPILPVQVHAPTGDEWLRVDVEGLEFTLMWQPQPTSLSFANVPHHRDSRLRIGFPNLAEHTNGQTDLSREDKDMLQDFMVETVGCFSMSDVSSALSP
jgi:hypothetical protein